MTSSPAFYTVQDDRSKKRMYQFGRYFSSEDPAKSNNENIREVYSAFKDKRSISTVTRDFMKIIPKSSETFAVKKFKKKTIEAALYYPLKWITYSNDKDMNKNNNQATLLDMPFFKKTYMMESDVHNHTDEAARNKKRCEEKSLFRHQKFVEYVLRPYSPIRSLIINSRTGSGKTRMMQTVMDNFACFPNKKIILFPNEVLREAFYNEYVKKNSKYYKFEGSIHRETKTNSQNRTYEVFDEFNRRYSKEPENKCTVLGRFDHPLFEDYYQNVLEGKVQGATIVLTFEQFYVLCNGSDNLNQTNNSNLGSDMFVKNKKIDLGGAMILVDEAHLLLEDSQTGGSTKGLVKFIRETLEEQAPNLHTIGLFTATPFDDLKDIVKYKKLLNLTEERHSTITPKNIATNHMMYYINSLSGSKHMFNQEKIIYIDVPESIYIKNRTKALGIEKEKSGRLSKHCWYTRGDFPTSGKWDAVSNKYETPGIENGGNNPGIRQYYDRIMTEKWDRNNIHILKQLYPKMAHALENVMIQHHVRDRRIQFWSTCKTQWDKIQDQSNYTDWGNSVHIEQLANALKLTDELQKVKLYHPDYIGSGKNTTDQQKQHWGELITTELDAAYDDRIVVMTDFDYGIIEFSKLLSAQSVSHAILQIEKTVSQVTGDRKQLQGYDKDFEGSRSIYGTFMDNTLVDYVNKNREHIPVILFNSYVPEGISLLHTRHLHVLTMDTLYTNISQMIGRINRLCNTTKNDKEIYLYCYTDSYEKQRYHTEYSKREDWPRLNPVSSFKK